ncbi:MAG TPA: amidase [Sphingopyxis sp.]|uniref:amidase n=1 Tax=Sphingopyxis sp. TaxID=1908224 RepID=UPI002E148F9A|nr:amidase [Sphingopyxis sp.]
MIDFGALKAANAPLHAFLDWDEGAAFGDGPLAGLTVGVKANIMMKGLPWTGGLAASRSRIADRDADCVARLRAAGAAILGTLNMEEAALGAKTDNPHYGRTHNPHRPGWSPGGSSGGSGAAVAAGLCGIALGTDTMGSVRIPAAHCGVYGFKPATARVSQDGLEPADLALDAIGPLARDLDLLERTAELISEVGTAVPTAGAGCTLADHGVELHPAVARAFAAACAALPQPPVAVRLDHPPGRVRFAGFIQVSRTMAEHLAEVPDLSPHLAKLLTYGPRRSDADRAADAAVLARTRAQLRDFVAAHGFLILPTCPNPAFSHDGPEPAAQADFTCLANIAGLPALALPAGWTDDGLPVGVQLVGAAGQEAALFALARQIDSTLCAYRAP